MNRRFLAQAALQGTNQGVQINRVRVPKVEDLKIAVVAQCSDNPVNDIAAKSVITPPGAITKNRDGRAARDQIRKLMNCQVGPLTRAVDSEETEADCADVVQVGICKTDLLSRDFRSCIWRDGLIHGIRF